MSLYLHCGGNIYSGIIQYGNRSAE